ncbi:hypothetical protein PI124_g12882 [Phytophthora idaei]|nr:hypothetical protein PI125_g12387 [Phytophthora idaei]KAG3150492.1 hypothetical protein PI126_g11477 [Phytophthora idaei]KAG3242271.1 hypothetical protein PI124_g12882 [Phytophthora idaei]
MASTVQQLAKTVAVLQTLAGNTPTEGGDGRQHRARGGSRHCSRRARSASSGGTSAENMIGQDAPDGENEESRGGPGIARASGHTAPCSNAGVAAAIQQPSAVVAGFQPAAAKDHRLHKDRRVVRRSGSHADAPFSDDDESDDAGGVGGASDMFGGGTGSDEGGSETHSDVSDDPGDDGSDDSSRGLTIVTVA